MTDNCDYVPTKPLVLFSHHFASIAGGGPIIGPTLALMFGFMPVWLWIVVGSIFIGGVHDMTVLFASVREKGKSVAEIARATLGKTGFFLFICFTVLMLLMVTSAFLGLSATALTSLIPLNVLKLQPDQTILRTVDVGGVVKGNIGGIASTSVIIITCFAPLIGYLVYKKQINLFLAVCMALTVCVVSILVGVLQPVTLTPTIWMIVLCIYTLFAAGVPVWVVLQPRDFTNAFLLYIGIAALFIGALAAGLKGITFSAPAWNIAEGQNNLGPLWPILFITVACGAISGFHSLVAGGTSSKQIAKESHVQRVAYGGMLLEGILAMGVLIAVGCGLTLSDYSSIAFPTDPNVKSNPILAFAAGMGGLLDKSLGVPPLYGTIFGILMVEGFVVTTLDTAVRLNRYLFEELWQMIFKNVPKLLKTYLFNALLCVVLMFLLAYKNTVMILWPVFGSANQLLAGLALIAVSVWLIYRKKNAWFTILPAIFMMATTLCSLVYLLFEKYLPKKNVALSIVDILLVLLSVGVIYVALKKWAEFQKQTS